MKVILNSEIEGKGDVGDIVEVKPGFARNFLFPKQMAYPVTSHNLVMMKARKKQVEKKLEIEKLSAQEQVKKLEEITLTFEKKSGENDVLFGSVTTSDIEKQLADQGVTIERKKIHLEEQIKRLGNYTCKIKMMKDVEAEIKIVVVSEEGTELEKEPESVETEAKGGVEKEEISGDVPEKAEDKPEESGTKSGLKSEEVKTEPDSKEIPEAQVDEQTEEADSPKEEEKEEKQEEPKND